MFSHLLGAKFLFKMSIRLEVNGKTIILQENEEILSRLRTGIYIFTYIFIKLNVSVFRQ